MEPRIREATWADHRSVLELYRKVARESGGLARRAEEVHPSTIDALLTHCLANGIALVLDDGESGAESLVGMVHASAVEVADLDHLMNEFTILLLPEYRGRGFGKKLIERFLLEVRESFPHIYRVELRARSSNQNAIALYEQMGFEREGLFRSRIRQRTGELEDGVPMAWFNPNYRSRSDSEAPL